MQIVIDILEEDYERVVHGRIPVTRMRNAIRNGTPLQKGHGRLIDASDLFNKLCAYASFNDACELENSLQTIIEADRAESEKE